MVSFFEEPIPIYHEVAKRRLAVADERRDRLIIEGVGPEDLVISSDLDQMLNSLTTADELLRAVGFSQDEIDALPNENRLKGIEELRHFPRTDKSRARQVIAHALTAPPEKPKLIKVRMI